MEMDNESVPFDQKQDDYYHKASLRNHRSVVTPDTASLRPFDEESHFLMDEHPASAATTTTTTKPVIQSRVHGPHRSPQHQSSTGNSSNHNFQSSLDEPRFRVPPLRISKPALDAGLLDEEGYEDVLPNPPLPRYEPNPPAVYRVTHQPQGSQPVYGTTSTNVAHRTGGRTDNSYEEFGDGSINTRGNTTEEDDSLFDFEGRQRHNAKTRQAKKTTKTRSSSRGDETSEDGTNDPSSSLTRRAQEAWKRKSARERKSKADPHVSFAAKDPSVHRYNEYTTENSTLAGASLNSEYTKSMESEVEDAIKDIFLIGTGTGNNPGRRKLKHRPDMRRRLREEKKLDDETLESEDETTRQDRILVEGIPDSKETNGANNKRTENTRSKTRSTSRRSKNQDTTSDGLLGAWTMVESGLQAVGAALGIEADDETTMTGLDSQQDDESDVYKGDQEGSPMRNSKDGTNAKITNRSKTSTEESRATGKAKEASPAVSDFWPSSFLSSPKAAATDSAPVSPKDEETKHAGTTTSILKRSTSPVTSFDQAMADGNEGLPSLDKDLRLIELAVQAARSYHKLKGLSYDESDVDIVKDVKFIVVDLVLPLGLIFQENESGCWVTKVLTEGSAIKKSIQVGDQLAAIDGLSAIRLTVEDIALSIRKKKSRPFELTFLRYVGPLKPASGAIEEQGYEVKARTGTPVHNKKAKKIDRRQKEDEFDEKKEAISDLEASPGSRDKRRFRLFGSGRKK
jgi:hypothetical protein